MENNMRSATNEGRRIMAVAIAGYLLGMIAMAITGYDTFEHTPAPVYSFFSMPRPAAAFALDFAGEFKYIAAAFALTLIPGKRPCVYAPLFVRAALCGFSSVYLYGTRPGVYVYLTYAVCSALCVFLHACAAARLSLFLSADRRQNSLAVLVSEIMFFTGLIVIVMLVKGAVLFFLS